MPDKIAGFRCKGLLKNGRVCNKLLADGVLTDGEISIKCNCGTINKIVATPKENSSEQKNYVYNTPYQHRIPGLIKK